MKKFLVLLHLPFILVSCESIERYPRGSGWMHHDGTGIMGYGWGGIVMWLLLFAVIIIVAYAIMRNQGNSSNIFTSKQETPLEILKKRYARGEISKEEYDRIKEDIS